MKTSLNDSLSQRIIDFLKQRITPCLESEILSAVSGRRKDKIGAIRSLRSKGLINFTGLGKKGSPFFYSVPILPENPPIELLDAKSEDSKISFVGALPELTVEPAFKTYPLPNGNILRLSREQFAEIVELFRLLFRQSKKSALKF